MDMNVKWNGGLNFEAMTPFTASSISASSKTISGAFPPSSIATFLTVPAQSAINFFPTSVEPVKLSALITELEVIFSPIIFGFPTTTLRIPLGTPALSARTAIAKADRGVSVAGLIIMGHPAAKAGPALRAIMAMGKFHGVIAAVTPIG